MAKTVLTGSTREAIWYVFDHYKVFARLMLIPLIGIFLVNWLVYDYLITDLYVDGENGREYTDLPLYFLNNIIWLLVPIFPTVWYAVSVHRLVLLGEMGWLPNIQHRYWIFWVIALIELLFLQLLGLFGGLLEVARLYTWAFEAMNIVPPNLESNSYGYELEYIILLILFSIVSAYVSMRLVTLFPHIATALPEQRNIKSALMLSRKNFWGITVCFCKMAIFLFVLLKPLEYYLTQWSYDYWWPIFVDALIDSVYLVVWLAFFLTLASIIYRRLVNDVDQIEALPPETVSSG